MQQIHQTTTLDRPARNIMPTGQDARESWSCEDDWLGSRDRGALKAMVLAGRAVLTLSSDETGKHLTFKISRKRGSDQSPRYFVRVLGGDGYDFVGTIGFRDVLYLPSEGSLGDDHPAVLAFRWFWLRVHGLHPLPGMRVRHEGTCMRCARRLTDPVSIDRGYGPECAGKIGLACA